MRGWNLNENEDLMHSARSAQRDADRELKATHHAARMVDLAGEASEVLDGMTSWYRQDCSKFCKELDWELKAIDEVNTKLELPCMPTDRRQAARRERRECTFCRTIMEQDLEPSEAGLVPIKAGRPDSNSHTWRQHAKINTIRETYS
jgi:hypothetical protein